MNIVSNLHNHDLLLNNDTSNEEKFQAANDIIKFYELPLSNEQILFAFEKMRDHLLTYNRTMINKFGINRTLFFNELLNNNKNMYVAIILAICNNFRPASFQIIAFGRYYTSSGSSPTLNRHYCNLLDYHEFDVSNISTIPERDKEIIQTYRADKYFGKLTKCATK